ncbi:unnamed protein product [Pleuronectes platessa]|uniref:Uncharacterized protein n=1 Tax=Pleuronectes platessa TaxID=8262 RepID=A0A9N7TMC2_PLEPL|nr:unnamed protein product [Pleuronectes platessa]
MARYLYRGSVSDGHEALLHSRFISELPSEHSIILQRLLSPMQRLAAAIRLHLLCDFLFAFCLGAADSIFHSMPHAEKSIITRPLHRQQKHHRDAVRAVKGTDSSRVLRSKQIEALSSREPADICLGFVL